MFDTVSNLARLWHAARMLSRHDALMPKEMRDRLPPSARAARIVGTIQDVVQLVRIFAGDMAQRDAGELRRDLRRQP